ncbi:phosphatidylglycerol lysyltransferase domain-containing protein [Loktanella sp. S4079]|uniref:phosphatidylglycerol lysyltransferase domain-containing protein n=1 Tax=Loktanella sp. S4079 TaxID=579483 RepID=UPI0005F9B3C7|nr:phosphatidylglycerol lysyltransferase domain-containing protein [Loktanella sp. S4079]KJZ20049.1 hypothetical protein TW80_04170 [Loktanella sp. S4079]
MPRNRATHIGKIALRILKLALPLAFLGICGALLWSKVAAMDHAAIWSTLLQMNFWVCIAAACATWVSLRAVGQYDAIWHEILRTGVPAHRAAASGTTAVAISQSLGFGAITASLARLRLLPQLTLWQITQLSAAISITFMTCWALYALIATWWLGTYSGLSPTWVVSIACASVALLAAAIFGKDRLGGTLTLRHIGRLMGWTMGDIFFATLALYVLIPADAGVGFATVLAAFIIALGAGLMSNSPGGAGAFDLTIITLLNGQEELVAALIAFRLIYYVIPALIAAISLAWPTKSAVNCGTGPALWTLTHQTGDLLHIAGRNWFIGKLPFFHCSIGAQQSSPGQAFDLCALRRAAKRRGKCGVLYNCSPRLAATAARAGWFVRRIAMEAIIRPQEWTTHGPKKQRLRRKLRNAEAAGVSIVEQNPSEPIDDLQKIARDWAIQQGGEMGFSMGRFSPELIREQRTFRITINAQTYGFVTFCTSPDDWHLDLIRYRGNLPDGAIHMAIAAAIEAAATEGVQVISLASVPDPEHTPALWAARKSGLMQFKRSFVPIWVPRYHAAPNRLMFWLSGFAIAIAIHRPLQNLPWKMLQLIKKGALELKSLSRREKRLFKQNGSPERS